MGCSLKARGGAGNGIQCVGLLSASPLHPISPKSLHPAIVHQPVDTPVGCSASTSKTRVPSFGAVSIGCQSISNVSIPV